jgi:transcriptional regulator with XRE-family HTH domain
VITLKLVARSARIDPALATALRRLREERGLPREELAYRAGISVGALARIELGHSSPSWATVAEIARALGVTMAQLGQAVDKGRLQRPRKRAGSEEHGGRGD